MAGTPSPFASRAVRATKGSASLRVTVPQVVATLLGLQAGDDVVWTVDPASGVVRVEGVHRVPSDSDPAPGGSPVT
jgi:antidote-toxin recognition MazE-like antitoxin